MDHERADGREPESMSIARCRELLGEDADSLTDEDVERIREHADTMAHVIIALFLEQPRPAE